MNDVNHIDIAIDGADEVDGAMNLIKGGGAAHTLEKVRVRARSVRGEGEVVDVCDGGGQVVATMAARTVIIVDQSKVVSKLGTTFPVPVSL